MEATVLSHSIQYPPRSDLLRTLRGTKDASLDFIILITGALQSDDWKSLLDESIRVLRSGGVLFVQGRPDVLPEMGVYLDHFLNFKYWIAVESSLQQPSHGLPSVHAGILLFSKGNGRFNIRRIRLPHKHCQFCGKPLRDWGGKVHLMHPEGYAISDVWKDLPLADNYYHISRPVVEMILRMLDYPDAGRVRNKSSGEGEEGNCSLKGIIAPKEGLDTFEDGKISEPAIQYKLPGFEPRASRPSPSGIRVSALWNVVHHGDALEILRQYPDNSVDLVFADPPYNLDKSYNVYDDEQNAKEYLEWCNAWLEEYVRILKPTGSLYVLNLPRWAMHHAAFLNRHLFFQNWIVWDALSEPRGKLMPAHYGLLFYTKHPTNFTFNLDKMKEIDARHFCLRPACIRKRKANGYDDKEPLTDIWWDIHRLKHRRDRDYHPCQLPDALMERIICLSTNPGDVVLDALAGTGTTAVVAARLGRQYVAIDVDEEYVKITRQKIEEVTRRGFVPRQSIPRPKAKYTKKTLQLELRDIAYQLGRLPTPEDVQKMSRYGLNAFLETFPNWSKALKAAKLEVGNDRGS